MLPIQAMMKHNASHALLSLLSLLALSGPAVSQDHGEEAATEMGPVAFMWPPDREWGAAQDNRAPCGSSQGVVNRTEFPLVNGQVALVMQDEAWHVMISVAYTDNPTSNDDFELLIDAHHIPDVDPGHECYGLPQNTSNGIQAGANATLQLVYLADFDDEGESTGSNETFYACADVTFVEAQDFTYQVPCFNATVGDFDLPSSSNGTDDNDDSSSSSSDSASASPSSSSSSSGGGLSGGAIAGIVVGVIGGVGLLAAGAFFIWRLRSQRERLRAQEASVRAVKWDQAERPSTTPSEQGGDVALRDISPRA